MSSSSPCPSRQSRDSPSTLPSSIQQTFRYEPLDLSRRSIRVIHVRKELREGGLIACDIKHTTTKSEYRALSYVWGDATDKHDRILLNGYPCYVRHNLWTFLKYARSFYPDEALWIDALSIDQLNMKERNHQVQIMSRIYSSTREVLVWLSPERDRCIEHAMTQMRAYRGLNSIQFALKTSNDHDFWRGFNKINNAEYWERVWIIQEFCQPKRGRILSGDSSVSFKTFEDITGRLESKTFRRYLRYYEFGPRRNKLFSRYMTNIHPLWQRRASPPPKDRPRSAADELIPWPALSGSRFCQDIRDRVYGVLPLSAHGAEFDVDYRLNPFELMLESIWLEHDSDYDRAEILRALANILELTPEMIKIYSQINNTGQTAPDVVELCKLHALSTSSEASIKEWHSAMGQTSWKNFMHEGLLIPKHRRLDFPDREQCPWQMHIVSRSPNIGFKVAMETDSQYHTGSIASRMTKKTFFELNSHKALALGVYETRCTPWPMKVYFALVDGLRALPKENHYNP